MDYLRKISQLKVFRHSYKDPLEFYNHVLVMPNHVASITGLDVLRTDYKKSSFNFVGLILVILLFFYVTFFTVYEMRHHVEDLIYCLVTIGICLQVVMKIYTHLYYRDDLLWIQQYTKELFQEETAAHKSVLMGYIEVLNVIAKAVLLAYGSCSCTMLTVPIVFTLLSGHKTLTFGFWLPFIDRFSWHGWILNMVMQIKEELQREIYDISWYTWTIQNQKVLRFMLEAAQQPNCLSMIFYPLSMPTFTEVIRTIYSILTLLLTFRSD
ncbi:hypothetical protein quinque_007418 [Culex quinquefasciatus]